MEKWFVTKQINKNTFVISEPYHWEETNCYLLLGSKKALLIDTGLGICNICDEVRKITKLPVVAVPTHVHWDHIGGLWDFSEFYVHELEKDWIEENFPLSNEFVRKMLVKGNNLIEYINVDDYAVFQGNPKKILIDGDIIDLGNRKIKVLHTPGHSPGHMCFFEEATGYLFSGDLIYKGTLFANYESTDPEKYLESVQKISNLPVKRVFPAHHSIDILTDIISDVDKGLTDIKKQGKLCHGSGLFEFNQWSIIL
ncbi:MAG: MBL fold metallo-hydrolase [Oscillospiraceae bacterium]|nr:MBL fold metallo-hydrolase [Oscillospiraceae bacterium]